MSAALSGPPMPCVGPPLMPEEVDLVNELVTPGTSHDAVRLVLQPDARIALAMVVRWLGVRYGLSSRIRSRRSNGLNVPCMKEGPELLPSASTRFHLASMNGSNASLTVKCASRLRLIRSSFGSIDSVLYSRPVVPF